MLGKGPRQQEQKCIRAIREGKDAICGEKSHDSKNDQSGKSERGEPGLEKELKNLHPRGETPTSCPATCLGNIKGKVVQRPESCGKEPSEAKMQDEEIKRRIVKRRCYGPERTKIRREVSIAFYAIIQKMR